MADSVVQVDLSDQAADFRRLALQPGMGLIDKSGAHFAILRKWLGPSLAEPIWNGHFVAYQLKADDGQWLSPKAFELLTAAECKGAFRSEIANLAQKLEAAPARTGTERALRHVMLERLKKLQADANFAAQSGVLGKYQEPSGIWRLVWLWGYERKTSEPGAVAICKKPSCRTLGVISDENRICTACGAKLKVSRSPLPILAALLLLGLIGGGVAYWLTQPPVAVQGDLFAVQGQVFSSMGQKPISGAIVTVEGCNSVIPTDAEGRFEISDLTAKSHKIRIAATGFQEETIEADLTNHDHPFLKVALRGNSELRGQVRDQINKAPIPQASISLPDWDITIQTDAEGKFDLKDLPSGVLEIKASASGFETKTVEQTLSAVESLAIDFELAGQGKLRGTVMDALTLQPVPQATVFLLNTPFTTTTDTSGRFEISGIPSGSATIAVQATGYQAENADQILEATEVRPFLVGLHGAGEIRGRVISQADAKPLVGANVKITHPKYQHSAVTNSRGEFEFQKLPPGPQDLSVTQAGYRESKLQVAAREVAEPVEIALSGDAQLAGLVTDALEKKPLADVEVRISGTELATKTGENGEFQLTSIPAGKTTVQIVGRGYRQEEQSQTLEAGKETHITVELKGGTILAGRVLDDLTQQPIAQAEVKLGGTTHSSKTDTEGRFRFEDIVAGGKTIIISAQGYQPAEQETELKTDEEANVEVGLKGDATLTGTVVALVVEKPLEKARIKIAGTSRETETDAEGKFHFEHVPSGPVELEVTHAGYQPGTVARDLPKDQETQVEIALSGSASIQGTVTNLEGQPLANATVRLGENITAATDEAGEFRLEGLLPGNAQFAVSAKGYHPEQKSAALADKEPTSLGEIKLRPVEIAPADVVKAFDGPNHADVIVLDGTTSIEPTAIISRDDFRTRLERANAQTGDVQVSLLWDNVNDLDLHVQAPSGEVIYYQNRQSRCGGELDVDMNANGPDSEEPVENIYWPLNTAPRGKYKVLVHHYASQGGTNPTDFRVAVKNGPEVKYYTGKVNPLEKVFVCEFERLTGPEPTPISGTLPVPVAITGNGTLNGSPPSTDDESDRKKPPIYNRTEEEQAAQRLKLAEDLLALNKPDAAKRWLEDVVNRYPNTNACKKCQKLLKELAQRGGGETTPHEGIYLSEMTPVRKNVGGELQPGAASLRGDQKHHALWTRTNLPTPPATVEYALGQRYSRLSGSVGIDDSGKADRTRVATKFSIVGDGKVLWSSQNLREPGTSERFEVDVSQVSNLKILTDSNQNPSHYAVWINPWLAGHSEK